MRTRGSGIAAVWLVLCLTGCAAAIGRHERVYEPPQPSASPGAPSSAGTPQGSVMPTPIPSNPAQPQPLSGEPQGMPAATYPRSAEEISGQAVVSLMKEARDQRTQNQPDRAAASLERAMRIEPRNYFVWSMLAQVYLEQHNYDQAISVAGKSNSLARGNVYVEIDNWKTIGAARTAQGDSVGALQAQAKVDELQRRIGG